MLVNIPSELEIPFVDIDEDDEDMFEFERLLFGVIFVLALNLSMLMFTKDSSTDAFFLCEYDDPCAELLSSVLAKVAVSKLTEETDV